MDLTGKWRYIENYGYGVAEGELYLKQKGQTLAGRIVFTDKVEGESSYMIQEFLKGELEGRKVRLEAVEFDIIHSEFPITYQLDHWFGLLVDDNTIKGVSKDGQGVEGYFEFEKVATSLPMEIRNACHTGIQNSGKLTKVSFFFILFF